MIVIISIIIPAYKAKDSIVLLCERLTQTMLQITDISEYEIIIVEDCGYDGSWEIIESLARRNSHIRAIQLSRNFGQHKSITAGLALCKGDYAVVMDCDLQDQPEDIPLLWNKIKEGFDIVNARRANRHDVLWRKLASKIYHYFLDLFSGLSYNPQVANFRIINRKVIDGYLAMQEASKSFGAQVQWLGFSTGYVDVHHDLRRHGNSSYNIHKLVAMAVDTIASYSNRPLQISVWIGFFIFIASMGFSVYLIIREIVWAVPVEGWVSLMVSLWFLGGIIIANMGIMGLYIGKIYDETKRRPIYVIDKKINC